jgi:hypothetical protein
VVEIGVPVYRDYAVSFIGKEGEMNLSISLEAKKQNSETTYNNVILNGVEIFKVSAIMAVSPDPIQTQFRWALQLLCHQRHQRIRRTTEQQ